MAEVSVTDLVEVVPWDVGCGDGRGRRTRQGGVDWIVVFIGCGRVVGVVDVEVVCCCNVVVVC